MNLLVSLVPRLGAGATKIVFSVAAGSRLETRKWDARKLKLEAWF